jgi:hypothetical protein
MARILTLFFPKVTFYRSSSMVFHVFTQLKQWWVFLNYTRTYFILCNFDFERLCWLHSSAASASEFRIPIQMECSEEAWVIKITLISSWVGLQIIFLKSQLHQSFQVLQVTNRYVQYGWFFTGEPFDRLLFDMFLHLVLKVFWCELEYSSTPVE